MSISIEEFRSDPARVNDWREILEHQITREVLAILRESGPECVPVPRGLSEVEANVLLGDEHGYVRHHRLLIQMSQLWPRKGIEPEPDYAPPENEEQE